MDTVLTYFSEIPDEVSVTEPLTVLQSSPLIVIRPLKEIPSMQAHREDFLQFALHCSSEEAVSCEHQCLCCDGVLSEAYDK